MNSMRINGKAQLIILFYGVSLPLTIISTSDLPHGISSINIPPFSKTTISISLFLLSIPLYLSNLNSIVPCSVICLISLYFSLLLTYIFISLLRAREGCSGKFYLQTSISVGEVSAGVMWLTLRLTLVATHDKLVMRFIFGAEDQLWRSKP